MKGHPKRAAGGGKHGSTSGTGSSTCNPQYGRYCIVTRNAAKPGSVSYPSARGRWSRLSLSNRWCWGVRAGVVPVPPQRNRPGVGGWQVSSDLDTRKMTSTGPERHHIGTLQFTRPSKTCAPWAPRTRLLWGRVLICYEGNLTPSRGGRNGLEWLQSAPSLNSPMWHRRSNSSSSNRWFSNGPPLE